MVKYLCIADEKSHFVNNKKCCMLVVHDSTYNTYVITPMLLQWENGE